MANGSDLEHNVMYYVEDEESRYYGKLVYCEISGWKNHLGQSIKTPDFETDELSDRSGLWIPKRKQGFREIVRCLEQSACVGFFHFTDVQNLTSIFEHGVIASRDYAEENELMFSDTAGSISENNHLVDGVSNMNVRDYARFTVQSDNPILYHWEGIREPVNGIEQKFVAQPCIIRVSPSIATVTDVRFARTNANKSGQLYGLDAAFLGTIPIHTLQHTRNGSTPERGAELLYPIAAPVNFIQEINFRSIGEYKHALNLTKGWFWQEKMSHNPPRFNGGKYPTYLGNALVTTDEIYLPGVDAPDKKEISWTSPEMRFDFILRNVKPGQHVKVELYQGRKLVWEGTRPAQPYQKMNFKNVITSNGSGRYRFKLSLISNEKEYLLYSPKFKVA